MHRKVLLPSIVSSLVVGRLGLQLFTRWGDSTGHLRVSALASSADTRRCASPDVPIVNDPEEPTARKLLRILSHGSVDH